MPKAIAAEVKATPSSQKHPSDTGQSGAWQLLGKEIPEPATNLKSEKGAALLSATANFIYMGGTIAGAPPVPLPPIPSGPLKLEPKSTQLTSSSKPVLVDGDTIKDSFGNELAVSVVSSVLKTD